MREALIGILRCGTLALGGLASGTALAAGVGPVFPEPAALSVPVAFWERVYVEIGTDAGFVHDERFLDVVYERLRFAPREGPAAQQRRIRARRAHWEGVLEAMSRGTAPAGARAQAQQVRQAWGAALGRAPRAGELRAAAARVRFQRGQRDKFQQGLVRSGAYEERIRAILAEHAVPGDLAYLPHVESSFNHLAYSRRGAAGMWQFIPATARRYLRVDGLVDERLDPEKATRAAAKLLRRNYELLGSWPLAITAYNHGAAGARRARDELGTTDIAAIIERYQGPRFGFASRNFYPQFLAARRVVGEARRHFGDLARDAPPAVTAVRLPFYLDFAAAVRALGVPRADLLVLNAPLRAPVTGSKKYIPEGFALRVPASAAGDPPGAWLERVAPADRHRAQRPSLFHTVRRGETLGHIAARHGTTVARLVRDNALADPHRIIPGQRLELPPARAGGGGRAVAGTGGPRVLPPPSHALDGRWAVVAHQETLGHFADWLDVPARTLRRLNRLSARSELRVGQRLRLDFSRIPRERFNARRTAHHRAIEAGWLARYRVTGTASHTLRPGETLWALAREVYGLPGWLLHRYNPHAARARLRPGERIRIPIVEPLSSS